MSTIHDVRVDDWLRRALPGRCAFCLGATPGTAPWCRACHLELPWNLPACPQCAEPQSGQGRGRLCGHCLRRQPAFAAARVPLRYEGAAAALIQRFKFQASPRAGSVLLALLDGALETTPSPQGLVAVPLHDRRARQRGFDQAQWLARRLAARRDMPLYKARRLRDTPSQRGLDRRQRRRNLRAAFHVEGELPAHVALLDDVMTTGATLDALARACQQAGARRVEVWAMARTPSA
ncbi:ComF family protein [Halomonas sp. 18H]|uniref:ComF family protein n=1 Tax=Halomonas almeriensis TaxID=308163 RepID=UPI002231494F|nr:MULTISPECIES: ComF family protein [Halomonas]MCW4151062.1 ComF family protein [Halomonas sp. 18H]MDN3552942.1 ComF family protein [Halomonas almeriensis]